jgi:hypothetical protein
MRAPLLGVAGLALAGYGYLAWLLPSMAGSDVKAAAQALLAGAGNGVKVASQTDPRHGEMKWIVSDDGAIRGWNAKNAMEVTLTPALQGGKG